MMKHRKLVRRKDGVKQRYWVGKSLKKVRGFDKITSAKLRRSDDDVKRFLDELSDQEYKGDKSDMAIKISESGTIPKSFPKEYFKPHTKLFGKRTMSSQSKRPNMTPQEKKTYEQIIEKAKKKGYKIPPADQYKGPLVFDEINILEGSQTEAWLVPDYDLKNERDIYTVLLDDDAPSHDKVKAFAHELGHVHLYQTGGRQTEVNANKIAADILDTSVDDIMETKHSRDVLKITDKK